MPSSRHLTFLGTGTSTGVPMLGCNCDTCVSTNPKNNRYRCSVLITNDQGRILIDTPPELRLSLLREKVAYVHALLMTHYHADHIFGLDDIRTFPKMLKAALPVYCNEETEQVIRRAFTYAFGDEAKKLPLGSIPQIYFHPVSPGLPFTVLGESITPIALEHGRFHVLGFRIGNLAYCTDVNRIPEASWPLLRNLDVLILDALRHSPHPTHFSLNEALEVIAKVAPKAAYLTHTSHDLEHDKVSQRLPENVRLAYDGLQVPF